MLKKVVLIIGICIITISSIEAQRKSLSLGGRIEGNDPNNFGITVRGKIHRGGMLEGIAHFYTGGVGISGLYERYLNIDKSGTFDFFYGGGAHLVLGNSLGAGIVGIAGLVYTFKPIPVNISLDWKPVLDVVDNVNLRAQLLGVSIRYTF